MKTSVKSNKAYRKEDKEREFWGSHSPLDFFDVSKARRASFPSLKPSLKSISIRLPEGMLDELKILAHKRDVPYQSLAKMYLAWAIQADRPNLKTK
ncbi:MAG: BrnA antitoxin family protein [bacterium]|jgi:predicted DNA binding CopG/RHH family protein